jgi:protein O-mannosyl-transferase
VRAAAIVACFALLLYLPALSFPLVWDDPMLLEHVHERIEAGGIGALLSSEFLLGSGSPHTGYFRPVVLLSLAADGRLGDGKAWVFHLTNLLLHASASGLVVLLLRRILRDGPSAVLGGLLFAAHPVHVETVAFVSGRTDLWASVFVLLATLLWLRERASDGDAGSGIAPAGVGLFLALGTLSKESAVMAVPAWLAWDAVESAGSSGRPASWARRNARWLTASLVAVAVVAALRWAVLGRWLGGEALPPPVPGVPEPSAVALLLPRLITYAKLLAVPWPLSAFYTPSDLALGPGLLLGAILALALFAGAWLAGGRRTGAVAPSWTLLFLVPVLGVAPLSGGAAAERFLYLPSIGACLAAAAFWGRLHRRSKQVAIAAAVTVIASLAGATVVRSQVWKSEVALYADMTRTSPRAFVAHFNLGNELAKLGRLEEAELSLKRAVAIAPGRADAWNNLGSVRLRLGKDAEAGKAYEEAVRLKPDFAVALRNLAGTLAKAGRWTEYLAAMEKLESPMPGDAPLLIRAGMASADTGGVLEAERAFRLAIRAAPAEAKAYGYLGFVYLSQDRTAEALPLLERAAAIDPGDAPARFNLGIARLAAGDRAGAAAERDSLRALDPRLAAELDARMRSRVGEGAGRR